MLVCLQQGQSALSGGKGGQGGLPRCFSKAFSMMRRVDMRFMTLSLASLAAVAFAGVMTVGTAHAVSKPGTPAIGKTMELVKGKKKSGPGHCGTMKYWDKKTKKCADATSKKV
jgi:hypothetical protein